MSFLDTDVTYFLPLITIGNILNNLYTLEVNSPNTSLFIPAFLSSFGGPLLGNLVYHQFTFSMDLLIIFFTLIFIFPYIKNINTIRYLIKIFPLIGKALFFTGLKNNKQPLSNIYAYLIVSEIFNTLLKRIYFYKTEDNIVMKDMALNFIILGGTRIFNIPDHFVFAIVFCTSIVPLLKVNKLSIKTTKKKNKKVEEKIQENLTKGNLKNKKVEEKLKNTKIEEKLKNKKVEEPEKKRRPVRRSSIASLA